MTIDELDKISEIKKRLKLALHVMGERGVEEDVSDGCIWVIGDILDIINALTDEKTVCVNAS